MILITDSINFLMWIIHPCGSHNAILNVILDPHLGTYCYIAAYLGQWISSYPLCPDIQK